MSLTVYLEFLYPDCRHVEHRQEFSGPKIEGLEVIGVGDVYTVCDGIEIHDYVVSDLVNKVDDVSGLEEKHFKLVLQHPYQH